MKMSLNEIMAIRHQSPDFNGGIFYHVTEDVFYRTRTKLGINWLGLERGERLPVEKWEKIEVVE